MLDILVKSLSNVGWRKKILGLSALYIAIILAIGLFGANTIHGQSKSIEHIVAGSQARVNVAANARVAIVEMGRALANVIAAERKEEIRAEAIAAIRSLSILDEQIQTLDKNLPDSAEVTEMSGLIKKLRPEQMAIIKDAKANNDAEAMEKMRSITADSGRVNELSEQLVEKERFLLNELQQNSTQQSATVIGLMAWIIGIGLLIGVFTSMFAAYLVTKPLGMIEQTMTAVADGDLKVKIPEAGTDEIGRTVRAIDRTIANLNNLISQIRNGAALLGEQSSKVGSAAVTVNGVSTRLHDSAIEIQEETAVVNSVTENVAGRLGATAEVAQQTSESTKEASEQLLKTVQEFKRFQADMENTATATRELSIAAEKVTSITDTIRMISSQTNLLALNAAIEAARAGEHGRGFAVVADEVRQLAKRTEDATAEISGLVEGISGSVSATVSALETSVTDAKDNIEKLTLLADETILSSQRVQEMRACMMEVESLMASQSQAVEHITATVSALVAVSGDANRETDALNELSANLDTAATDLNRVVASFRL